MYKVILGPEGPTDCQLGIENTDDGLRRFYLIGSSEWNILSACWSIIKQEMIPFMKDRLGQKILKHLFEN